MKKKLIASFVSFALALVLMTGTTFAWFTVSTAPEITNVKVSMQATKNLEIARVGDNFTGPGEVTANDNEDQEKWGGQVTDFAVAELAIPATASATKIQTVSYGATGRTAGMTDATSGGSVVDGIGYYKSGSSTCAASYYVWLRTNDSGTINVTISGVKFGTGASVTAATSDNAVAVDATTSKKVGVAIRVATTSAGVESKEFNVLTYDATADGYVKTGLETLDADTTYLAEVVVFFNGENIVAADVNDIMGIVLGKVEFGKAQ